MSESEKDDELEELFAAFDRQFADCEQKFSAIEENLKVFRSQQDASEETPPETHE